MKTSFDSGVTIDHSTPIFVLLFHPMRRLTLSNVLHIRRLAVEWLAILSELGFVTNVFSLVNPW